MSDVGYYPWRRATLHKGYDPWQHAMLAYCSYKGDSFFWNDWRGHHSAEKIRLKGAHLEKAYLREALLWNANLQGSNLLGADLQGALLVGCKFMKANLITADLRGAKLDSALLHEAYLEDAMLQGATLFYTELQGANMRRAALERARLDSANLQGVDLERADIRSARFTYVHVDGMTTLTRCLFNKKTNFTGVGLDSATIHPGLKTALKNNIRRIHWTEWVNARHKLSQRLVRRIVGLFWELSDYGSSTKRIIKWFLISACVFAVIYWLFAMIPGSQSVIDQLRPVANQAPFGVIEPRFGCMHTLLRSLYFSIVTMTTLGFGDMHATTVGGWPSYIGYLLLSLQVLLGYVVDSHNQRKTIFGLN